MIFLSYIEREDDKPDSAVIEYCFHLVQDSTPPEFIKVPTEVEI